VFPYTENGNPAYINWGKMLKRSWSTGGTLPAGALYTGQHWRRAVAAAASTGAELWVISAGLGLLHVTDTIVSYEATYASMPFCHREHWSRLTTSPPTARRCASMQKLMQACPHDRFVIAASPVYLHAVEEDLRAGSRELASPAQLTIVTSKAWQGNLNARVCVTNAGMMNDLRTNMTGLNISYAEYLIQNENKLQGTSP